MFVIGITSKLKNGLSVFFWEYDDISEDDALEEANYLSSLFDFDVYVSESSPLHYHIVSCDMMSVEEIDRAQHHTTHEGDYWSIKETGLYRDDSNRKNLKSHVWCALRVGNKGRKPNPRFIKAFRRGKRLKSLGHYRIFERFCNFPPIPECTRELYVKTDVMISIFNTGVGAKPQPKKITDF